MSRLALYLLSVLFFVVIVSSLVFAEEAQEEPMATEDDSTGAADDSAAAGGQQQDFAVVYVHKDVSELDTIPGKSVTVTVTAKNVGTASAFDVVLNDKAPFTEDQSKKIDELAPGDNLTITYQLTPQSLGHTDLPQAEASFANAAGASDRVKALSNEVREELRDEKQSQVEVTERGFINVVTPEEYEKINATKWKEYILFTIIAAIAVLVPYYQSRNINRQISILVREAKRK